MSMIQVRFPKVPFVLNGRGVCIRFPAEEKGLEQPHSLPAKALKVLPSVALVLHEGKWVKAGDLRRHLDPAAGAPLSAEELTGSAETEEAHKADPFDVIPDDEDEDDA